MGGAAICDDSHIMEATLRLASPAHRLLAPLVRLGLRRDIATALGEDRINLEEKGYPSLPPDAGAHGPCTPDLIPGAVQRRLEASS